MQLGVIGVGSIGSVLARGFAELGHEVVINDADPEREAALPFRSEDKSWLASNCDICVIAVPTPTTENGGDASAVRAAVEPLDGGDTVCLIRSTMPPGESRRIAESVDVPVVYSPEFLRDRSGVTDFFVPDRIVIAGRPDHRKTVRELFEDDAIDCDTIIETDSYLTAEIAKEAHNAFFAAKVSFANQIRDICEQAGADPVQAMDIVTADARNTESHLDPMLGPYGGKCLPKDTEALWRFGNRVGAATPLLRGTMSMNEIAATQFTNVDITESEPYVTADD